MRHLYDTHCVLAKLSGSPDFDARQFAARLAALASVTVERDVATYGNQHADFASDPYAVLRNELAHLGDDDVRARYEQFCKTMIWGDVAAFDEVTGSFANLASVALAPQAD